MAISASVFSGPTNVMAMGHPFIGPGSTNVPGVLVGIDARTRELVSMDPWLLKNAGVIHSAFGVVLAPKGYGKSATLKILAIRLMMLSAGYQTMHVAINDYKPEGRASEYELFTQACRSRVFKIAQSSVNPFESRLFMSADNRVYELGLLGVAEMICEFVKEGRLVGNEGVALRIALYTMLKHPETLWGLHTLFKLLRSITRDQIRGYYDNLDSKLLGQLLLRNQRITDPAQKLQVELQIRELAGARDNPLPEDVQQAGGYVSTLLARVLYGSYGHMWGDTQSLYEMYTQRAVTKDWRDVDKEPETLWRTIDTRIKVAAIENNRLDLLPHIEIDDEKHKSMDNPVYARSHSFFSEIARSTHTCSLSATHRLSSIRKGGVGSELYALGDTIINNLGWVMLGRQDNVPSILDELQARYRLSNTDTRLLTSLPKYTFGMKLGEEEPLRFVRVFATPKEMEILRTDGATDRMIDRPNVLHPAQIQRFADENGIVYLGQSAA